MANGFKACLPQPTCMAIDELAENKVIVDCGYGSNVHTATHIHTGRKANTQVLLSISNLHGISPLM